jgi:hypothetical protein
MPKRVVRIKTPSETIDINDLRVDNVIGGTTSITYNNSVSGLNSTTLKTAVDELDDLLLDNPIDNAHYRIASDGNGFNSNDNTKFFFSKGRRITLGGVTYVGSVFQFTNNFFQFEDFVITRNGTFSGLALNRSTTTWSAIGTTIFQPAGSNNWETSESGNHRITIIILDPNPDTANSNRIIIFEKVV